VALKTNGTADLKAALDWILAHRAQYNIVAVNYLDMVGADEYAFLPELQALNDDGVFIGGAVGNYGKNGTVQAVGALNHLIYLVGSVDVNDNISGFTPRGPAVDMLAPGENVTISWYGSGQHEDIVNSGTSWAGPQVTATAALIKQINPSFTPAQIYAIIRDSGKWIWDPISQMSYSRLDVNAAIALAYQRNAATVTSPPPPPPPPPPPVTPPTPAPNPTPAPTPDPTPDPAPAAGESPYGGTPFSTGQIIQAEDYDYGGNGIGYSDLTAGNLGRDSYRPGDDVDTQWSAAEGGTRFVGWTRPGEWLNYTINAASSGTFDLAARVASLGKGGGFHVEIDGKAVTGSIQIPNTGGWDQFETVTRKGIKIAAGTHIVRIVIDHGSAGYGDAGNIDSFAFTPHATAHRVKKHSAKKSTSSFSSSPASIINPYVPMLLRSERM
jgi:hypothetical protein